MNEKKALLWAMPWHVFDAIILKIHGIVWISKTWCIHRLRNHLLIRIWIQYGYKNIAFQNPNIYFIVIRERGKLIYFDILYFLTYIEFCIQYNAHILVGGIW